MIGAFTSARKEAPPLTGRGWWIQGHANDLPWVTRITMGTLTSGHPGSTSSQADGLPLPPKKNSRHSNKVHPCLTHPLCSFYSLHASFLPCKPTANTATAMRTPVDLLPCLRPNLLHGHLECECQQSICNYEGVGLIINAFFKLLARLLLLELW